MRVRDLPLSEAVIDHYEAEGIVDLYPPQAAAVDAGIATSAMNVFPLAVGTATTTFSPRAIPASTAAACGG